MVLEEIESGLLINPATKAQGGIHGNGALMLMDGDRLLEWKGEGELRYVMGHAIW